MSQALTVRDDGETHAPRLVVNGAHFLRQAEIARRKSVTCTLEAFAEICALLTEGASIKAICRRDDMPSLSAFWRFMEGGEAALWDRYMRARSLGAHAVAAEAVDVAAAATAEDAAAARLRFDSLRWYAGKLAPREYGDRLEGATVQQNQTVIFQVTK